MQKRTAYKKHFDFLKSNHKRLGSYENLSAFYTYQNTEYFFNLLGARFTESEKRRTAGDIAKPKPFCCFQDT